MAFKRFFRIDEVKLPTARWIRHIIIHYVRWVEVFGYIFCAVVASGIAFCWFYKVDEVAKEKAADVGKSVIKPHEEPIKTTNEAVVIALFVQDFARVKAGQPLAEVSDDAGIVAQRKLVQQYEVLLKSIEEMAEAGPLPDWALSMQRSAQDRVAQWQALAAKAPRRNTLTAPAAGEVLGAKDLLGKVIKAGDPVLRVVDFSDLRLSVVLMGSNVERVRAGQTVKLEVTPSYTKELSIRGDLRLSFTNRRRVQFNDLLNKDETKKLLSEWWKDRWLTSKDDKKWDVALPATEVSDIELLTARLRTTRTDGASSQAAVVAVEPLKELELRGTLLDGSHTATYRTSKFTPEQKQQLGERILAKVREKDIEPLFMPTGLTRWWREKVRKQTVEPETTRLRVDGLRSNVTILVKVKAKKEGPKTSDADFADKLKQFEEEMEKHVKGALDTEKVDRSFEGSVKIEDPPALLVESVRKYAEQDPPVSLTASVETVVGRRRLAMLLFRQ